MGTPRGSRIVVRRTRSPGAVPPVRHVLHGVRHAGESVLGGAQRALREVGLGAYEPWAVDLSDRVAVMAVDVPDEVPTDHLGLARGDEHVARAVAVPDVRIGFRPMLRADLHDVVRWTSAEHVARWWDAAEAADLAAAERHYGPALDGADPTRLWVVEVNGRSVGFVQDYLIGDHPEYAVVTARPDDVGFDYAIGEPAWAGRGIGTRMLWQFLCGVVAPAYPRARHYFAAPDHRNVVSLRVLDKLGFERGLWFDEPQAHGRASTMIGCTFDVRRLIGRTDGVVRAGVSVTSG